MFWKLWSFVRLFHDTRLFCKLEYKFCYFSLHILVKIIDYSSHLLSNHPSNFSSRNDPKIMIDLQHDKPEKQKYLKTTKKNVTHTAGNIIFITFQRYAQHDEPKKASHSAWCYKITLSLFGVAHLPLIIRDSECSNYARCSHQKKPKKATKTAGNCQLVSGNSIP